MNLTKVSLKLTGPISFIMAIITLIIVATKSCDIDSLMYVPYFFVHFFVQNFEKIQGKLTFFFFKHLTVFDAILRSYLHLDDAFFSLNS